MTGAALADAEKAADYRHPQSHSDSHHGFFSLIHVNRPFFWGSPIVNDKTICSEQRFRNLLQFN